MSQVKPPKSEGGVKDDYVLQRNYFATSRLNLQYYLWQDTFRFHLHPSIPELAPDARIAEVGTGSGIWLLDLSDKVPLTTQLEGFDISLSQTPPTAWLPSNVKFHQYNFFDDLPNEFSGRFDVVHVRLIALVVPNNDPSVIVHNLTKMLKPGGYLQWEEYHTETSALRHAQPGLETPALEWLRNLLKAPVQDKHGQYLVGPREWLSRLPEILQANDYDKTDVFSYGERKCMASFWAKMFILGLDDFANQIAARGEDPEMESKIREMKSDADEEARKGGAIEYDKKVVVGKKKAES